jgi:transposase InsO family protein
VLTDNAPEFKQVFGTWLADQGIQHVCSTPYHPQTNGFIERFHRPLKEMLQMYAGQAPMTWDKYLPAVCYAHATSQHTDIKYSPYEVMYGTAPRLPWNGIDDWPRAARTPAAIIDWMKMLSTLAQDGLRRGGLRGKRQYDKGRKAITFLPDDQVLVRKTRPSAETSIRETPWDGPYKVVRHTTPVTLQVTDGTRTWPIPVGNAKLWKESASTTTSPPPRAVLGEVGGYVARQPHGKTALSKGDKEALRDEQQQRQQALMDATKEDHPALIEAVWATYRETGWPSVYGPPPHASQWKQMRRWARAWLNRQTTTVDLAAKRWPEIATLPPTTARQLVEWIDTPTTSPWPLPEPPPINDSDRKLLCITLCRHPHLWL